MENKEKQIEKMEMAREIHNALLYCHNNYNCHKCEFRHDAPFCKAEYIAKAISEHYQPKLSEDSVVLSREEFESLKNEPASIFKDYQEMAKFYDEACEELEQARKETAEKIYNRAVSHPSFFEFLDWIKTEFDIEIEEN